MDKDGNAKDWSELICDEANKCTATVYSERIWDTQTTSGHLIEPKMERAFNFIGWYAVYVSGEGESVCPAAATGRRLDGLEDATRIGGDYCKALSG